LHSDQSTREAVEHEGGEDGKEEEGDSSDQERDEGSESCWRSGAGGFGCHGTLQGRGLFKSHRLSETPIVWRNTSGTFKPRGLGYNCSSSCELAKCFELKESDGELRRSCLRRQPACLQPCARLVIFGSEG